MILAPDGYKQADFAVNISNDGWFPWNEKGQHLQAASFRCIETRTPMARAVNTGISGFIDSSGRPHNLLPAGASGTRTTRLTPDSRITTYLRWGDWFAIACVAASIVIALFPLFRARHAPS
jgi:apolipoprotein N-acyltransferase